MAEKKKRGRPRKAEAPQVEQQAGAPKIEQELVSSGHEGKVKVRLKVNVHMPKGKVQKGSVVMLEQKYAMQLMSTGGAELING